VSGRPTVYRVAAALVFLASLAVALFLPSGTYTIPPSPCPPNAFCAVLVDDRIVLRIAIGLGGLFLASALLVFGRTRQVSRNRAIYVSGARPCTSQGRGPGWELFLPIDPRSATESAAESVPWWS